MTNTIHQVYDFCLTQKLFTRAKLFARHKRSSLLFRNASDGEKKVFIRFTLCAAIRDNLAERGSNLAKQSIRKSKL